MLQSCLEEGTSKPFLLQRAEAETPDNSGEGMKNPLTGEVTRVEYGRIIPSGVETGNNLKIELRKTVFDCAFFFFFVFPNLKTL